MNTAKYKSWPVSTRCEAGSREVLIGLRNEDPGQLRNGTTWDDSHEARGGMPKQSTQGEQRSSSMGHEGQCMGRSADPDINKSSGACATERVTYEEGSTRTNKDMVDMRRENTLDYDRFTT